MSCEKGRNEEEEEAEAKAEEEEGGGGRRRRTCIDCPEQMTKGREGPREGSKREREAERLYQETVCIAKVQKTLARQHYLTVMQKIGEKTSHRGRGTSNNNIGS